MKSIEIKTQIPGPNSRALMERRQQQVARGLFHVAPVFAARAEGSFIEDVDGNRFLDFASGIGVINVGHSAEAVVEAVRAQCERHLHLAFNVTPYESYVDLCQRLNTVMPGSFAKKTFLANSGAEAVENAIKIARAFTGRQAVIAFDHAFHGRTYMAMSLTAKQRYKAGFAPFNAEVYRAPFPYEYRWPSGRANAASECFAQFVELATSRLAPTDIAAVIIEPVLGEGGFLPVPREFFMKLREFCTAHKIVLIADEIQTGFGRTGTLFACEQLGVIPDLMTIAKGLGGGLPISAVVGRAEIMDAPVEGAIGGTYGGNPLACASALAVLQMMEDRAFLRHAGALGEKLSQRLEQWKAKHEFIGDVRGLGPMRAMEFVKANNEPDADRAKKLIQHAYENGLILMGAGTYSNVVRFLIPLTMSEAELKMGLDIIEQGLKILN